jgi:subfamily B ATP-binding cassette protein MsbA
MIVYVQYDFITDLRNRLFHKYLNMSLSFFNEQKGGELTSIIINDVTSMRRAFTVGFQRAFVEPLNIIAFLVLLFIINFQLALIAIIIVPITTVSVIAIGRSVKRKSKRIAVKIATITNIITEILSSIRVVKAFTNENYENRKFQSETKKFFKLILKRARLRQTAAPLTEVIGVFVAIVLILIGGRNVLIDNTMTSEDFLRFILVLFSALAPIRLLSSVNMEIQSGLASAERVFKALDSESEIKISENPHIVKQFKTKIEFRKATFRYNEEDSKILDGLSFEIKKGEVVALVGESGAGKSTIADLVPRFYDVNEGAVLIDNIDLREIELKSLRKLMGIVTQETILFNDTIRANISYGLPDVEESEIIYAAKIANALDFINDQPNGFDTVIGDKGIKLSGGQRQRIAIARAVLNNPPILILDEATSSLDTKSEKLVQEALENLMTDRTVLVIAHRLSTIHKANKIIALENGRIVEIGTHDSLIKRDGLYKKLYDFQFNN